MSLAKLVVDIEIDSLPQGRRFGRMDGEMDAYA